MSDTDQALETTGAPSEKSHSLFLVLEGGGAKGIAHVAAWEALEPLLEQIPADVLASGEKPKSFEITGVAGTSAGAVVAAFIAAGATSRHLVDSEGRIPLCDALGLESFHDIFGIKGWRRLVELRFLLRPNLGAHRRLTPRYAKIAAPEIGAGQSGLRLSSSICWRTLRFIWPALAIAIAFLLWFLLDQWVFPRPIAAATVLIEFWIVASICFWLSSQRLSKLERTFRRERRRQYTKALRRKFNPITTLFVATGLTIVAYTPLWIFVGALDPFVRGSSSLLSSLTAPFLYLVSSFLILLTLANLFRSIVKGTINTEFLADDLNYALITVLTKTPRWDNLKGKFEWEKKTPRDETEAAFFQRVDDPKRFVRFRDLTDATGISLSVVTADTANREVHVFSSEIQKNYPVALAVAASMAIPFVFRPIRTSSRILVDGGVVSSIPAWVYRRQRTRDPDARILAVGIEPTDWDRWIPYFLAARPARVRLWNQKRLGWLARLTLYLTEPFASIMWPLRFAANVASTAAFGARTLELDASDRLDSILLDSKFELLDFDKPSDEARREIERLKIVADYKIKDALWRRQSTFDELCAIIEKDLLDLLTACELENKEGHEVRIRMFWAEPDGNAAAVRIRFTYKFGKDELDDRLVLPLKSSMTGWAAATKYPQFGNLPVLNLMLDGKMNRYRRFVKWKHIAWCWALPITEGNGALRGVLAIESNCDLKFFGSELGTEAGKRAQNWIDEGTGGLCKVNLKNLTDIAEGRAKPAADVSRQMEALEKVWTDELRAKFSGTKDFRKPREPVKPHPKRFIRSLTRRLLIPAGSRRRS